MPLIKSNRRSLTTFTGTIKAQAVTLGTPLSISWAALGANTLLGGLLNQFGIVPRTERGLWGILFAPFLHANVAHLAANSISLLILGWLTLAFAGRRTFWIVSASAALGAGLCAWTFGAPGTVHIGASGVIFGLAAYLILAGFMMRRWQAALVAVVLVVLFGGMFYGVLPQEGPVSWESHLSGALAGVWAARRHHPRT